MLTCEVSPLAVIQYGGPTGGVTSVWANTKKCVSLELLIHKTIGNNIVAIFFSAISEIEENYKGVLVKVREVLRN